jgi:predicted NAD/FAD-dependent oxidoreductase
LSLRVSSIGRYLADGLTIKKNTAVARLDRECGRWRLTDSEGNVLGEFDWVVAALPAAQARALVPTDSAC